MFLPGSLFIWKKERREREKGWRVPGRVGEGWGGGGDGGGKRMLFTKGSISDIHVLVSTTSNGSHTDESEAGMHIEFLGNVTTHSCTHAYTQSIIG